MSMRKSLVLAAALMIGAAHAGAHDTTGAEVVAPVMKQAIPEAAGKNVLMATVSYKPGQASEAHMHPGSIFAYVLEGHVTSQLEGSAAKTYGPGESWYEAPGAHHIVSKNASATKPAKLLVFAIVGEKDPVKQPIPH
ncbi:MULTISPECIES: cupin domain-containing protein [Caballeronia]|jgi:quercetin dioxygenase-like cupin family protein|uniref:Cupin domain-containing protein n=3 Tax=Burkholderiaceae TaxID=119060 RepID=A0AA37ID96_9BURK|nr:MULTISPECIES: cupin domain-containing protein [Caballeronia]GJH27124.1 cupin domain-containing protein [Caballeronia novacaledonica]